MLEFLVLASLQAAASTDYRDDFDLFCTSLEQNGAYVRQDKIDLNQLRLKYRQRFATVSDKHQLLSLWESCVGELHDFHATLNTNNGASPRLVPSGTDLFGRWKNGHAFIDQVKSDSLAEKAKLATGDEIIAIGGRPTRSAAANWLSGANPPPRAWDWGLNSALAGRWNTQRILTVSRNGQLRTVQFATAAESEPKTRLTFETRPRGIAYVRVENSLGQDGLISDFDHLVLKLRNARGIVLDLRNTPSGGNSNVARGIMGLFIDRRLPFQRHRFEERNTDTVRDWVEYASPRLQHPLKAKLVVLVGRWTGSMGEGLAIGFDGMRRATVVGTRMAGLRGAVDGLDLPHSGFRVNFPTEQVFHINGTPRHEWLPPVQVHPSPGDPWYATAVRVLES